MQFPISFLMNRENGTIKWLEMWQKPRCLHALILNLNDIAILPNFFFIYVL